ncbi:MAG: hypothetical protein V3S19_03280, partial [Gemmatimonadales bacterium]
MLGRFKRQLVARGARCAGGLLLLSAPVATPAIAQSHEAYRAQIAAVLAQTNSTATVGQELAVAQQHLAAIRLTPAIDHMDLVDPVRSVVTVPMVAGSPEPDDSLFSAGREALNRNRFREAGRLFEQLRVEYPGSAFVPSALYWEAFSRYRMGGGDNLRTARRLLDRQLADYPSARTHTDAMALATRIDGALAAAGDSDAA